MRVQAPGFLIGEVVGQCRRMRVMRGVQCQVRAEESAREQRSRQRRGANCVLSPLSPAFRAPTAAMSTLNAMRQRCAMPRFPSVATARIFSARRTAARRSVEEEEGVQRCYGTRCCENRPAHVLDRKNPARYAVRIKVREWRRSRVVLVAPVTCAFPAC